MTPSSRPVWHEGMHLAQHHFQAQGRYFEDSIQFALGHLFYKTYGVAGLELDAEALRNGTVSIVHARGVMPDGLAFHCPDGDPLPQPLEIRELFSPTQESHLVLLTVPPYHGGQANTALEPNATSKGRRYLAETTSILDETTGLDEKPVTIGRKNFSLALEGQDAGEVVSMPLARVRRDGAGHFIYDPDYIPPCLQIGASPRLLDLLRRLLEILDSKSESMQHARQAGQRSLAEYAAHEVASFWFSHAIHASLGPLRYHMQARKTRPEQLFVELSRLAGALCTFALESHPRMLPAYDHDQLSTCFTALERHIWTHLEVIVPSSYVNIPLTPSADYLHIAPVTDQRCLGPSRWFLGIRSSVGDAEVIGRVPLLMKVCSQKHILRLVREAYAGLALSHLPSPPSGIAPRLGTQYFEIERAGPCWEAIVKTAEVGVYAPEQFRDLELELRVMVQQ